MPLFGATDEQTAGLMGLAVLIGGAVTWLANWWAGRQKTARDNRREDEQTVVARYEDLLARVDADREECKGENARLQAQIDGLRQKVTSLMVTTARAVGWIRNLEAKLDANKVPYTPWEDEADAESAIGQ